MKANRTDTTDTSSNGCTK